MPENKYAFFKGEIVPIEEAKISIMTSAFNYGTAIFEGIRAYWNEDQEQLYIFKLREHFQRFLQNCRILLIELPYDVDKLCEVTVELLRREQFRCDVYIRPLAYKSSEIIGVRLHDLEDDCAIFAAPFGKYIDVAEGAKVCISSWRRIDDNMMPARAKITGSYVNSALAKTEAVLNGFDEAIVLDQDGHVSEASAANIFIVRDGALITTPVTANILEGITRKVVIELAKVELNIETIERPIDRTELYVAEEVFSCGTAVEITPIIEVDHRSIGVGKVGPISARLQQLYSDIVHGKLARYREWCTPVYPE